MAKKRMDAAARKRAIVETAMPLFARKGFSRTTTKELAEQAGVSEALLYRHFPTKAALYDAIQQLGCQVDPALEELNALAPSTATLTEMVQAMFQHVVFGAFDDPGTSKIRQRLILQSLLEDGEYARLLLSRVAGQCLPIFAASIAAARRAGDLEGPGMNPLNAFWFAGHVATQIAHGRLPGNEVIPYAGTIEAVTADAIRFCLRGIGLTEAAIERHCGEAAGPGMAASLAGAMKRHQIAGLDAREPELAASGAAARLK